MLPARLVILFTSIFNESLDIAFFYPFFTKRFIPVVYILIHVKLCSKSIKVFEFYGIMKFFIVGEIVIEDFSSK